jgi:hypothetical protein
VTLVLDIVLFIRSPAGEGGCATAFECFAATHGGGHVGCTANSHLGAPARVPESRYLQQGVCGSARTLQWPRSSRCAVCGGVLTLVFQSHINAEVEGSAELGKG